MKTYAEYLTTQTVKTLQSIAKQRKVTGYSKLRKASLIDLLMSLINQDHMQALHLNSKQPMVKILDTEEPADHDMIAALIAQVATVAPVTSEKVTATPAESAAEAVTQDTVEETTLDDLKTAYRNMRATVNRMGGRGKEGARRIKYVGQLRNLSRELQSMGIKCPQYL